MERAFYGGGSVGDLACVAFFLAGLKPKSDPDPKIRVDRPHMVGNSFFGHVAYVCIGMLGEVGVNASPSWTVGNIRLPPLLERLVSLSTINQEGRYEAVRRYTEFITLRRAIIRKCPQMAEWLPRLPEKALLGMSPREQPLVFGACEIMLVPRATNLLPMCQRQ